MWYCDPGVAGYALIEVSVEESMRTDRWDELWYSDPVVEDFAWIRIVSVGDDTKEPEELRRDTWMQR